MAENSKQDILVMALFMVTRKDVLVCADELGMSEEQVTDDVIELVKEKVSQDLGDWRDRLRNIVKETIEKKAIKCPLGIVCSPSCAFKQVGECSLSRDLK